MMDRRPLLTVIVPASGKNKPFNNFASVDFPEPFCPITDTHSPSYKENETSFNA